MADFKRNILASFSKFGNVPDSYGALMFTLRIDRDSSFIVYGYNGIFTYDFTGKTISRVKLKDFQIQIIEGEPWDLAWKNWVTNIYTLIKSRHVDYTCIEVYRELRLMNWLDSRTGEKEPFIRFPENSIFRSGEHFPRDSWGAGLQAGE